MPKRFTIVDPHQDEDWPMTTWEDVEDNPVRWQTNRPPQREHRQPPATTRGYFFENYVRDPAANPRHIFDMTIAQWALIVIAGSVVLGSCAAWALWGL